MTTEQAKAWGIGHQTMASNHRYHRIWSEISPQRWAIHGHVGQLPTVWQLQMVQVAFHGSASNQKKSCGCLIWANRVITLERGQAPSQLQYKKNAVHVSKPSNTNYQLRMRFTTHLWIFMVSSRSELGMVDSFIYRMTHGLTQVSRSCATDNTQNGDIDMVLKNAFLESPQNGYCYCNPHV